MSARFLHVKRAYVTDSISLQEVERDIISNTTLLQKIYEDSIHDICAITEDGEWLMAGRKMDPGILLQSYTIVFIYIHSPSAAYDRAVLLCQAHAEKSVPVYKATDAMLHHTERLAALIKTQEIKSKVPHQVHVDMESYNKDFISSEVIAASHIRSVFLPVQIVPSLYKRYVSDLHKPKLAYNHAELSQYIDELRHINQRITLREYIQGDSIYVLSIPHFREKDVYVGMSIVTKDIGGLVHFQEAHLNVSQKEEIYRVVSDISHVLFKKNAVVFKLKVHGKRGVFVEATMPALFFLLQNHDFLFAFASSHGVSPENLFECVI